jgi:carbon-monoxide dehydrogenase medium subunit
MLGGTDIIPAMKDRVDNPLHVMDLTHIPGLDFLTYKAGEGFKIGCQVKLQTIADSKLVQEHNPAISEAAHYVASKQVRDKGTMVGNICNASPSCDTGSMLVVMNASVKVFNTAGEKIIKLGDFFKGVKKTALVPGDIVTEIDIPDLAKDEGCAYLKLSVRKAMDLAIIGVAAWVKMDGKKVADARICLGGVAITPIRTPKAEAFLKGKELTEDVLEQAGVQASQECKPISDVRASAEYRTDMVRVFTKRALSTAAGRVK